MDVLSVKSMSGWTIWSAANMMGSQGDGDMNKDPLPRRPLGMILCVRARLSDFERHPEPPLLGAWNSVGTNARSRKNIGSME